MRLSKNRLLLWVVAALILILVVILIMWPGFLRTTTPSKSADATPQPQSPKATSAQLNSPVQPQTTAPVKASSAAAQPALLPQTQARVDQNPNQDGGAMLTPRQRVSDPDPSYVSVKQAAGALQHDLQTACQAVIQPQFQSYTGSEAQCLEVWGRRVDQTTFYLAHVHAQGRDYAFTVTLEPQQVHSPELEEWY
ncbi:hypothetical protein E0H86_11030 [Acinetobacter sp. ANC 4635]|uniref:hypothetical protein n=1 Tax=Acinetobacter sp. ANC 4635 TaxID=2529846 RepID=UPI001038B647|nr:hypothetical protein [Acinetobacter sp. ANC 4635]TCB29549.1 hypothetical protein E0H86_11030 [Acinetobacter sp. ANC 4635]